MAAPDSGPSSRRPPDYRPTPAAWLERNVRRCAGGGAQPQPLSTSRKRTFPAKLHFVLDALNLPPKLWLLEEFAITLEMRNNLSLQRHSWSIMGRGAESTDFSLRKLL